MNGFLRFFLEKRVAVAILVFILAAMGAQAYLALPREAAPDLEIPVVLVAVPYPGVSPTDIESQVVRELEKELKDLKDLKVMKSTSAEGSGLVTLEFNPNISIEDAVRKVGEKVDIAKPKLPEDALEPQVKEVSFEDFPIISVNLSADYSLVALKRVAEDVQDRLETIKGVLEVDLAGGLEREIQVVVDPVRLAYHEIGIDEVVRAVQGENVNLPGGSVDAGRSSFLVRVPGEYENPRDIEEVVIKTKATVFGGEHAPIRVRDVGHVLDTYKERTTKSRLGSREAVTLQVKKRGGENLIAITDEVKDIVNEMSPTFPAGTKVTILGDQSKFIRSMVSDLQNNILTGLLLILLVLPFFLTIRSSFIVATAIPLALLITMAVLQFMGITLNMIVLFSLILSLGMLVDNSIVVVENTYRLLGEGHTRFQAALIGAKQVAWPVIASTATTVAAFVPLLFWPGIMGKFMGFLPRTLIITLLSSLFVALCINPVMCAVFLRVDDKHEVSDDFEPQGWMYRYYRRTLSFALRQRALVMGGTFITLIGSAMLYGSLGLGVEFFPSGTPDTAVVDVRAADGTRLDATDEIVGRIETILDANKHLKNYTADVGVGQSGGSAPHLARLQLDFLDEDDRTESSLVTIEHIRTELLKIPGARFDIQKQAMGPPSGPPVGVEVIGPDWSVLGALTQKVTLAIQNIDGLVDLKDDFNNGRPEVQVRVDRERAKLLGTDTFRVASAVRTAINGSKATAFRDGSDEYDITVRFERQHRNTLEALDNLYVTGREGAIIPLREVAHVVTTAGAGSIRHKDQDRVIAITANTDGRLPDEVRKDVVKKVEALDFPDGYSWRLAGENEEQDKAKAFLSRAFFLAAFSILLIIVLQFNSLLTPLIIMTSVLLSLIGVLWGLIIFQRPFGVIMTGLGIISLAGVAVNNAIVLIDFIVDQLRKGGERKEAITKAGVIRLRPVLLTAITTVLGLMPMVFGVNIDFINAKISVGGRSAEFWSGMAVAVSTGLVFTTFLTLVVVPVLYDLSIPVSKFFGRFLGGDDVDNGADGERAAASSDATTPTAAVADQSEG